MEQCYSVPISGVIATLLLSNRKVTNIDIVNFESKLANCDIGIDIYEDDNIDNLFVCVEVDDNMNFKLKDKFGYDSIIYDNVTVRDFLSYNSLSDEMVRVIFDNSGDEMVRNICINQLGNIKDIRKKVKLPWKIGVC